MADDHSQRPYRTPDKTGRNPSTPGSDPLAELARLIGQSDPFAEFGRDTGRHAAQPGQPAAAPTVDWNAPPAAAPVPGYAPRTPKAPPAGEAVHPAAAPFPAEHYADDDLYHTEAAAPDFPPHAEDADYEQGHAEASDAGYGAEHQDYYDDAQPRRRMGILAIAAIFALAVIGTAGAFGYHALFGSVASGPPPVIKADTAPSKIIPAKKISTAKLIQDRAPAAEKLVSREEKPVDIQDKPAGVFPQNQASVASGSVQPPLGSGVIGGEPKKIHTITIRPDQPGTADAAMAPPPAPSTAPAAPPAESVAKAEPAAAPAPVAEPARPAPRHVRAAPQPQHHVVAAPPPANAPLSLSPDAPTRAAPVHSAPMRTASAERQVAPQPAHLAGGYAVQISSRRSEADARAALRNMQAKYPSQLAGSHPLVRRVDLGSKGIYYRAMIGPYASSEAASKLCSSLKAAGAHCFVQRI